MVQPKQVPYILCPGLISISVLCSLSHVLLIHVLLICSTYLFKLPLILFEVEL